MKKYFTKLLPFKGKGTLMLCTHDIKPGDRVITPAKGRAFKVLIPISIDAIWVKEGDTLLETDVRMIGNLMKVPIALVRCNTCNQFH